MARKVVGVGSVGTRGVHRACCRAATTQDPLFLQVKEATRSVLEGHLPKSRYHNPGERVVQGQRMMQATSDIFLGWTKGVQANRYLYWRQLRDMKGSALVDTMSAFSAGVLRRDVRVDAGPGARPRRRRGRHRRLPRRRRRLRHVDHRLLRSATPTRTKRTTRYLWPPCAAAASTRSKESETPDSRCHRSFRQRARSTASRREVTPSLR